MRSIILCLITMFIWAIMIRQCLIMSENQECGRLHAQKGFGVTVPEWCE